MWVGFFIESYLIVELLAHHRRMYSTIDQIFLFHKIPKYTKPFIAKAVTFKLRKKKYIGGLHKNMFSFKKFAKSSKKMLLFHHNLKAVYY